MMWGCGERIGAYDDGQLGLAQTPLGAGRNYAGNAFGAGAVTFSNTYPCCIYGSGEIAAVGSKALKRFGGIITETGFSKKVNLLILTETGWQKGI
jgi:hypothetical protein